MTDWLLAAVATVRSAASVCCVDQSGPDCPHTNIEMMARSDILDISIFNDNSNIDPSPVSCCLEGLVKLIVF